MKQPTNEARGTRSRFLLSLAACAALGTLFTACGSANEDQKHLEQEAKLATRSEALTCTTNTNTCKYARDGACDDGGPGSDYTICDYGSDAADCGQRVCTGGPTTGCNTNSCKYANDGTCDDGGPGSAYGICDLGTDAADCGTRTCTGTGGGGGGGGSVAGCPNDNSCRKFTGDGVCDDGGPGSKSSVCAIGTDRTDCGYRYGATCTESGPTPVVFRAYVQKGDCDGGTGADSSLVVEGTGFEVESAVATGGFRGTKRRIDQDSPQPHWNRLTTSRACSTYCCGPGRFTGKTLSMIGLSGKESNAVIIENAFP